MKDIEGKKCTSTSSSALSSMLIWYLLNVWQWDEIYSVLDHNLEERHNALR